VAFGAVGMSVDDRNALHGGLSTVTAEADLD